MDAPRIQYLTSKDGAKIAYWMLGEGGVPLLMQPPLTYSNILLEWQIPELRAWYEHLCADRLILRWDSRGQGSSERRVSYSWDNAVDDLETVAGLIKQDVFDLLAFTGPNIWAMQFAADHPERLRKLVLWAPLAKGYGPKGRERVESLIALAERDWDLAVESFSHATVGWSRGQQAHFWAKFIRDTITQDDFVSQWREILRAWSERDLSSVSPRISTPTLVLDLENPGVSRRHATLIASTIQNAQLLRLEGALAPYENEQGKRAVDDFLGYESGSAAARTIHSSGTAIILFIDIVDSTALTERLGDAAFREKARDVAAALRSIIAEHGGRTIEGPTLGDGVLATFASAREAIESARRCAKAGDDAGLPLHLGLHAGDVAREKDPDGRDNVYGGAVNIASRVSGLSAPGEVLVSETVRSLARTSAGVSFEDRGEQALKGVGEAVRVWAVV